MRVDPAYIGRILVFFGVLLVIFGGVFLLLGRIDFLGNLPGDITIRRGNFTLYFPLTTFILISILLTVVMNVILRR